MVFSCQTKVLDFAPQSWYWQALSWVSAILGAQASDEPIKLGAPIPITGPFASDGFVMEKAEKLAIAEINAQGGLLGRQIEMIVFDIGDLTPDKLQAAALNLVEKRTGPTC